MVACVCFCGIHCENVYLNAWRSLQYGKLQKVLSAISVGLFFSKYYKHNLWQAQLFPNKEWSAQGISLICTLSEEKGDTFFQAKSSSHAQAPTWDLVLLYLYLLCLASGCCFIKSLILFQDSFIHCPVKPFFLALEDTGISFCLFTSCWICFQG